MFKSLAFRYDSVLFIINAAEGGGAEKVADRLCKNFANSGLDVKLIATYQSTNFNSKRQYNTVVLPKISKSRFINYIYKVYYIRKELKKIDDRCLVISFLTNVNVLVLLANIFLSKQINVSERSFPPIMKFSILLSCARKFLYPRASTLIVQTQDTAQWAQEHSLNAKIKVIRNPLPNIDLIQIKRQEKIDRIVAVGRLDKLKNHLETIKIFELYKKLNQNASLDIFGDGPELMFLQEYVARNNIMNVTFKGYVSLNVSDYTSYDLFLSTSLVEGYPNSILEAICARVPVIATHSKAGISDLIEHGDNGFLVPQNADIHSYIEAINSIPSLKMSKDTYENIVFKHSDEYIVTSWLNL